MDPTWIVRLDAPGDGPRLAVKDCIDVEGLPTTAGCQVVAEQASPAAADAPVVAAARRARARIVGKTSLTELCWSIASMKTTWGRVPLDGVYPLAPSMDTVGPLGTDVAAVELGMRLIDPGFGSASAEVPGRVGRIRPAPDLGVDPATDAAVDAALAGLQVSDVTGFDFRAVNEAGNVAIDVEAYPANAHLLPHFDRLTRQVRRSMTESAAITADQVEAAQRVRQEARDWFAAALDRHPVLALPTLTGAPPLLGERGMSLTVLTVPANLAGLPALSLPVPGGPAGLPASLQLIGPPGGEERLIALGRVIEAGVSTSPGQMQLARTAMVSCHGARQARSARSVRTNEPPIRSAKSGPCLSCGHSIEFHGGIVGPGPTFHSGPSLE